jgi:hypothetical protein
MVSVLIYTHIIPNHVLLYLFFGSLCAELLHHLSLLAMLKKMLSWTLIFIYIGFFTKTEPSSNSFVYIFINVRFKTIDLNN